MVWWVMVTLLIFLYMSLPEILNIETGWVGGWGTVDGSFTANRLFFLYVV